MLYREIYARCNEETKMIIDHYLSFFGCYSLECSNDLHMNIIRAFDNKIERDIVSLCYLFYIASLHDQDLNKIITKYNINYHVPYYNQEKIKNVNKFKIYAYELFWAEEDMATNIFKAFSNLQGSVCIERIIFNFLNISGLDHPILKEMNINKDFLEEINALAILKEKINISQNNIKQNTDLKIPFGEDLTNKYYPYNPLIGREKEYRLMCAFLMDKEKSVIIHGLPGVGKTTLIEGLAYNIQNGLAPQALRDKKIISTSGSELISGCKYVGMVEERVLSLINSLLNQNAILFIDEVHTLMGLGKGSNSNNDVSNILKPYLGNGSLKIIGATTTEELHNILENGAFARRFNNVELKVLSDEEIMVILKSLIARYEEQENITFKYSSDIQEKILKLILEYTNLKHQNYFIAKKLYNPDFALTILRNAYDFALLDNKESLDIDSIIEGFKSIDFISETYKDEFANKARAITKENNIVDISKLVLKKKNDLFS